MDKQVLQAVDLGRPLAPPVRKNRRAADRHSPAVFCMQPWFRRRRAL